MTSEQLKLRTKQYSLSIINLVELLPTTIASRIIANQIAKSGTSVGANYRARSDREFIAKMKIVLEEADETLFWLETIMEKKWLSIEQVEPLWKEGNELTAIFVSSLKTVKAKLNLQ